MLDVQFLGVEELLAQWSSEQARISAGMAVAVADAAREGAAQARASAPRRTGTMIDHTDGKLLSQSATAARGEIRVGVDYASFVSDGTPPHIIEAKRAKTLAFEQDGVMRYPRRVRHPGTKANRYLDGAVDVADQTLRSGVVAVLDGVAARMRG